jgi:hypothetical protein
MLFYDTFRASTPPFDRIWVSVDDSLLPTHVDDICDDIEWIPYDDDALLNYLDVFAGYPANISSLSPPRLLHSIVDDWDDCPSLVSDPHDLFSTDDILQVVYHDVSRTLPLKLELSPNSPTYEPLSLGI